MKRASPSSRPGLSLLEVLVALAIFLFALVGLGTLITLGGDRALDVRQQSWAIQRCQSKLAEVMVGAVPLSPQSDVPFEEDPDWHWSLEAEATGITGLWNVTVRVMRQRPDGSRVETSLTQLVPDPSLRGGSSPASTPDTGASSPSASPSGTAATGSGTAPARQPTRRRPAQSCRDAKIDRRPQP